ncbi:MAG TPA: hypothetical protein VMW10_00155 [Alphaproteobacteria bacterium]|nr:hypothetical protein [Alphaproteobacteria bacterium]
MNRLLPIVDECDISNKLQDAWIASGLRPGKDERVTTRFHCHGVPRGDKAIQNF